MPHHPAPRSSPPRRHLVITGLIVLGLHVALLGSPVRAWSVASVPGSPTTPNTIAQPTPPMWSAAERAASPVPGLMSLRVQAEPQGPAPVIQAPTTSVTATPSEIWEIAQASTESEQSLRSNTPENKALSPVKVPGTTRLQFDVLGKIKGFGYTVSGELMWQQDGRQYQARYEIGMPLLGSRVQTSQGQLGVEGLLPQRFGDKVRSEQAAHFERDKGLISFSANTPSAVLEPGAQDRLSLFMQLASLLAGAPQRYPTGAQITLQTVSAREAEPWTFRVDGLQTLELPFGTMQAIRLTRLPRQPYDQQVDLWFAPSRGYLPVRLRVTHPNGDVADQVLRRLDPPG